LVLVSALGLLRVGDALHFFGDAPYIARQESAGFEFDDAILFDRARDFLYP
jgi:hypothetical protein